MLYSIDKIIDDIVLLENLENKEKKELERKILPKDIKEGNIIRYENNNYQLDIEEENKRRKMLLEKLSKVKD